MSAPRPVLGVGVLGAGTVGSQVIRILQSSREDFAARSGAEMEVRKVLVRNVDAPRDAPIDRELLTTDPAEAIDNMDLVVELIGGIEPARTLVLRALNQGISVVTGNKALLAAHGPELYEAAASNGADLYYEAAVAGAVPVVYGLRESLAGDRVTTVMGIVNGTTNFILDAMSSKGLSYEDALKQAQDLGFAEARAALRPPRRSCRTSSPRRITAPSVGTPRASQSTPTCRSLIPARRTRATRSVCRSRIAWASCPTWPAFLPATASPSSPCTSATTRCPVPASSS